MGDTSRSQRLHLNVKTSEHKKLYPHVDDGYFFSCLCSKIYQQLHCVVSFGGRAAFTNVGHCSVQTRAESVFGIFVGMFSCRFGIGISEILVKSQIFGIPHLYLALLLRVTPSECPLLENYTVSHKEVPLCF